MDGNKLVQLKLWITLIIIKDGLGDMPKKFICSIVKDYHKAICSTEVLIVTTAHRYAKWQHVTSSQTLEKSLTLYH